ncbi:MAG: metal ABC transporter substrate-binding protein, partial [Candidatus Thorarchaeota archaeon]
KVVTTISIIADWANQIGGSLFSSVAVVTGSEDPHTYSLTSGEIEMIGEADLFVRFGLPGLEPWVQNVLDAYPSLNVLTLAQPELMEEDPITGDPNPHVWMSPILAKSFVENITNSVIAIDFTHKSEYETNRDNYLADLDDLISRVEGEYADQLRGLKVVVHHPAFFYLLELLEVERVGVIEEHEGSEPSAQHIQEIVDLMKTENISTIVTQPQIEEDLIIQIARDTNAKLAKLTPLLNINNIDTYIDMIEYNVFALQNPEEVTEGGWIYTAIIIGGSFFLLSLLGVVYIRYFYK